MFLKVNKFNEKTNKKTMFWLILLALISSVLIYSFIFTSPVISLIVRHVAIILLLKRCLKKEINWDYFHLQIDPHFVFWVFPVAGSCMN